jgi:hypothetical protein
VGAGFNIYNLGHRIRDPWPRVQGLGLRVYGSRFRVQDSNLSFEV